jgi:D-alanyl-D-alanine carboxypeptidase/D-alanyl-D-alanine-endopeptidase (penicillin-binding protein 4)
LKRRRALVASLSLALCAATPAGPDRHLTGHGLEHGIWAYQVVRLTDGKVVASRDSELNVRPASTLKLFATAAALDAFGPDYRHQTTVVTDARLDAAGRLEGDLQLVGGGDPNLSGRFHEGRVTAVLEKLADAVAAAGVREVAGRVVGNESRFAGPRRGDDWTWDDLVWWYGAEVSALSFNDNCADLNVRPGARVGDPVVVQSEPRTAYFRVTSTATTVPAGTASTFTLERDLDDTHIRLSGGLPQGAPADGLSVALPDPARYAATVFAELLQARGVRIAGGVATTTAAAPAAARVLARHEGEPMAKVVEVVNKRSQNLHAELLLRLVGTLDGGTGTVEDGVRLVEAFAKRVGVDLEGAQIMDGSGLSRSDLVTTRALVQLLVGMERHPQAAVFRASLPIGGVDGSLRNRFKGTPAEGRVMAKTGSLRSVWGLAGYVQNARGEPLAFALVANNHTPPAGEVTAAMDAWVTSLVTGR